jgi:hypothetical protein
MNQSGSPRVVMLGTGTPRPDPNRFGPATDAKLIDRFFHRRRQVSPPVNSLTHRFFDGSQHLLYCNVTVCSRHGVAL